MEFFIQSLEETGKFCTQAVNQAVYIIYRDKSGKSSRNLYFATRAENLSWDRLVMKNDSFDEI